MAAQHPSIVANWGAHMLTLVSTVVRAMRIRQSEHKPREHTFSRSDSKLFDMHKSPTLSLRRSKREVREGSKRRNAVTSKSARTCLVRDRSSYAKPPSIPNAKPQQEQFG